MLLATTPHGSATGSALCRYIKQLTGVSEEQTLRRNLKFAFLA